MNKVNFPITTLDSNIKITRPPSIRTKHGEIGANCYGLSMQRFIHDEVDFDFVYDFNSESRTIAEDKIKYEPEELLKKYEFQLESSYRHESIKVPDANFKQGFKAGAIDYKIGAFIKTESAWVDEKGALVAMADCSVERLISLAKERVEVLPTVTYKQLEEADISGELIINDELIAQKADDFWYLFDTGIERSGNALRALHHQNKPFFLQNDTNELASDMYHSTLELDSDISDGNVNCNKDISTYSVSRQGSGFFMAELDEVVKIYANGTSVTRKNMADAIVHTGADKNYDLSERTGVVFECKVDSSVNIYDADFYSGRYIKDSNLRPSHHLIKGIIDNTIGASPSPACSQIYMDIMGRLSVAESPFDIYMAIDIMGQRIDKETNSSNDILSKVMSSIGYDAIKITPPSQKDRETLINIENQLNKGEGSIVDLITEYSQDNQIESNLRKLHDHLKMYNYTIHQTVVQTIDKSNIIIFGDVNSKVSFNDFLVLPKHSYFTHNKSFESLESDKVFANQKSYNGLKLRELSKIIEDKERDLSSEYSK